MPVYHKKNKTLSFVAMWMKLEDNYMLKLARAQLDKYHIFIHLWKPKMSIL